MASELDNTRIATLKTTTTTTTNKQTGDNKQKRKRLSGIIKNAARREESLLTAPMDQIQELCDDSLAVLRNWHKDKTNKMLGLILVFVQSLSHVWLFENPWIVAHQSLCAWDFPGKSTGAGCYFLLQGIFPTQGSTLGLLLFRQILYHLSQQGDGWWRGTKE